MASQIAHFALQAQERVLRKWDNYLAGGNLRPDKDAGKVGAQH